MVNKQKIIWRIEDLGVKINENEKRDRYLDLPEN